MALATATGRAAEQQYKTSTIAQALTHAQRDLQFEQLNHLQLPSHKIVIVDLRTLILDFHYQRPLSWRKVERLARGFEPLSAAVLLVNNRGDGTSALMDGQHRAVAAMLVGYTHWPSNMTYGLSRREEAHIFWKANSLHANMHSVNLIRAALEAEEPDILEMVRIVEACGFRVATSIQSSTSKPSNLIQALGTVARIYGRNELEPHPTHLVHVLNIMRRAWEGQSQLCHWLTLQGVYQFVWRYNGIYDEDRLIEKLSNWTLPRLHAEAHNLAQSSLNGHLGAGTQFARIMLGLYNERLRGEKALPDRLGLPAGVIARLQLTETVAAD